MPAKIVTNTKTTRYICPFWCNKSALSLEYLMVSSSMVFDLKKIKQDVIHFGKYQDAAVS